MFEVQELFLKEYSTYTTTYAYVPLFISFWNMQEHLDSTLFWAGGGCFCGISHHFAFLRHGCELAIFFIAPKKCIFRGAPCMLIQKLASLNLDKIQGFHGTFLYHRNSGIVTI